MENDDERQKKLKAGLAKLKSFQKKKSSKKKKKAATSSQSSNSRDSSQSEEPTSDLSTTSRTVSTNNYGTISDEIDTDHSSTTAEDIFLSQDGHYQYEPSAEVYKSVEKWKRMTEENICLKEKVKKLEQERKTQSDLELSIGKLRSEALQTAEQYEHSEKIIQEKLEEKELKLKENLQQLTEASEALEKNEKERRQLEERVQQFSLELNQQKETVAHRANQCQLLTQELEDMKNTTLLHSATENNSANHLNSSMNHSMAMGKKDEELNRLKKSFDDAKLTFERRLQEEQVKYQELQHNKSMSDEVNTVFQKSSSKQLTKLENENTSLLAQLEAIRSDLQQLESYQELTKTLEEDKEALEKQLTEVRVSCHKLTNDNRSLKHQLGALEVANERLVSTESKLDTELVSMRQTLREQQSTMEEIRRETSEDSKQYAVTIAQHEASIRQERGTNAELLESAAQAQRSHQAEVRNLENKNGTELEQLRSEQQQEMDQLRRETERQLEDTRTSMESEQREQMSTIKDVTERSRGREIDDLSGKHKEETEKLIRRHNEKLESQRNELNDVRAIAEERLRTELQDGFDAKLESELASLRHGLDRDSDLARFEFENKHKEEAREIDDKHEQEMKKIAQEHQEKVAVLEGNYQQLLEEKLEEAEEVRVLTAEKLSQTDEQMVEVKSEFVREKELIIAQHQVQVEELNAQLKQGTDSKEEELASLKSKFESLQEELEGKKKELISLDSEMSVMRVKLEDDLSSMESKLRDEITQISSRLQMETEDKLSLQEKFKSQIEELNTHLSTIQQDGDEQLAQAEESRSSLVSAHEERISQVECSMKEMERDYEERCQSLQSQLKSATSGNENIQLMSDELRACEVRIAELEKSYKTVEEERSCLLTEHADEIEEIKKSHKDEMDDLTVKMEQMLNDMTENKDKLQQMNMFSMQLISSSSPIRPSSPSSEYDSSGVTALTKDYRSTLKLTRVADISGVSDDIVQSEDSSSSSSDEEDGKMVVESTPQKSLGSSLELSDVVKKEIGVLYTRLEQATTEFTSMKQSRDRDVDDLMLKHGDELERIKSEYEESSRLAEVQFQNAAESLKEGFDEQTATIRSEHQRLVAQIRLECASDTAKQVEDEMTAYEKKLRDEFDSEFESLKHRLESEHDEKVKEERVQHAKEMEKQADDLSESMETRISAVLRELDGGHQETIRQLRVENEERYNEKLRKLQHEFEISNNEKETLLQSAEQRRKEFEEHIESLKLQLDESRQTREDLMSELESGENSYIKDKEETHQKAVDQLRKDLRSEFDIELKTEMDKQATMYSQEQDKFLAQHQQQLESFTGSHEEVAKQQEIEFNKRLETVTCEVRTKYEKDIKQLQESHDEELKAIATLMIEESAKKSDFQNDKEQLLLELQKISSQRDKEITELRSNLVKEHMAKFEEVTATLDEHHKKEMEQAVQEQRDEAARLRHGLVTLQKQIDSLQEEQALELESVISSNMSRESHTNEMTRLRAEYEKTLQDVQTRLSDEIKHSEDTHRSRIQNMEEDRLAQMSRVEEEVQMRVRTLEENQLAKVKKLEEEYVGKMEKMKSEYNEVRESLSKNDDEKQQFLTTQVDELSSKIMEMNEELVLAVELRNELDETTERRQQLEQIVDEYKSKQDELEGKLKAEEELREKKIAELEKFRETSTEEYQDALNRIEFERAEYEAEIDNAQAELSYKDENVKELEGELERKTLELKELNERCEKLTAGRESMGQIDELDASIRDDLDKLREEKKQVSASNERLMLVISQLVDYNNRCEQLITSRLADLPDDHGGKKKEKQTKSSSSSSSSSSDDEEEKDRSSGSLVEGILDHDDSQQQAVVDTGVRVKQSVDRLFNLLYTVLQQLNESQQSQSFLQEKLDSLHSNDATMQKEKVSLDEECPSDVDDPMDSLRRAKEIIVEKTSAIQQMKQALFISERNEREAQQKLTNNEFALKNEMVRLKEEKALIALQKSAISEGRDETEINLLQAVETLAHEKQTLKEEAEEERKRFLANMQILEDAVDENQANTDKTEENYLAEIDDLKSQVGALMKHAESGSKYTEHLTDVCESERIEFENEKKNLHEQIDTARETAREEFSQKVKNLEDELLSRQQSYEKDYSTLQTKIEEQEEKLNDCERLGKLSENEMKSLRDALSVNQDELGDVTQQRELLEKDLHSNLMRISELEGELDNYRIGIEDQVNEGKAEAHEREKMSMMQYKMDMQEKDNQISLLLEQQNDLRGIIVQNERRIDNLIAEVERLQNIGAEHSQLQKKMKKIETEEKTKPEDLHLLSEQLIEDKNDEISELKREVTKLKQQGDRNQMVASMQEKLESLQEENQQLRSRMNESADLDTPLRHADLGQTIVTSSCQTDDVDTGISLVTYSTTTPHDGAAELEGTQRENERLQHQLEETERRVRDLLQDEDLSVIRFAPGTKEKIRDLEERMEKFKFVDSSDDEDDEDDLQASLREIEAELKEANKNKILTRILQKKDDQIDILESELTLLRGELDSTRLQQDLSGEEESQNLKVSQMEAVLQEKENEIAQIREKTLQDKDEITSTLTMDLKEARDRIEELQDELETRIEADDVTMASAADSSTPIDERLNAVEKRLQIVTRERERGVQQLNDVQRECGALLDDNNKLEDECRRLTTDNAELKTSEEQWKAAIDMGRKHEELVKKAHARSEKLVQENGHLQEEVTRLNDLMSEVEQLQEENDRLKVIEHEKHQLQVEHARLSGKLESLDESKLDDLTRSHGLAERLDLIEEDHSVLEDLDVRLQRLEAGNEEQLVMLDKYKEIVADKPRLVALQKQVEELKKENRKENESSTCESSQVAQVELRIKKLEAENTRMAELFSKYDEAVFQDKQRYTELKEAMGKLETENSKLSSMNLTVDPDIEDRSRLEQLESRIEQLEAKTSSADDVLDKLNELEEDERFADELQDRLESLQQENERLSDFEEVNKKLEKENETLVGMFDDEGTEQGQQQRHLYELQKLADELKLSLENARHDNEELKEEVSRVSEEYNETRVVLNQLQSERDVLLRKLESLMTSHSMDSNPQQQQKQQQRRSVAQTLREHLGSGDARSLASKTSTDDEDHHLIINKDSDLLKRLADENSELRENIQNLTFRSEELEIENESMQELHADEIDRLRKSIEEINNKSTNDEDNKDNNSTIINVPAVDVEVGDLKAKLRSLEEEHRVKVEVMKRDFNVKLEEVVKERDAHNDEKMTQMLAKYQQELDDSSSIASEWELARKLREELEIADNINARLLQKMHNLPAVDSNNETADDESIMNLTTNTNIDLDYASTDAETSNKIQRLFKRLHNEGIQVLSLSELQFLNQHSLDQRLVRPTADTSTTVDHDKTTTSEQLQTSPSLQDCKNLRALNVDNSSATRKAASLSTTKLSAASVAEKKLDILRKSWENEKLALLESIEALKKLYTDTVINSSVDDTPLPSARGGGCSNQQLQWRDNLLRAVGDVFERERRALVAELQSSVIDAQEEQADGSVDYPSRVAAKLEALERRVRAQDDLHRSEMERLITADRDELVADMRYMKADGDHKLKKLQSRVKEVQDHQRNKDESQRQTVSSLTNQIQCLESRLNQLTALNDDLKASLEAEVKRTRDVHESLDKERERTSLLANEILRLEQSAASDESVSKREVQMLRIEVDASKNILQQASRNLENVKQDSKRRENEIRKECDRMKKMHVEDEEKIADLEEAIIQNEKLRSLAITAIEEERTKTRMICEDLKNQREKAVDRADNCETRCNDLENEVGAERRRCDELRNNLEAEAIAVKEIRQKIDRDRREVEEAREKDRIQIHRLELQIEGSKRERAQFDRQRDEFEEEKVIMLKKIERMREDVCKNLTTEKSRREQNVRAERELRDKIQEQLDRSTIRLVNAERRIKELEGDLENERIDKDFEMKRALSSSEMSHKENVEPLLLHRRQLENIRQRLHTETSRLQRIISYNAQQSTQDPTQLDELKRTTQNLQQELRDLHTNLSLPKDFESEISTSVRRFNDRVLRHNARLAEEVASCVSESIKLRDRLVQVEADNERLRINHDSIFTDRQLSASNASKHKMAVRIHKLYFRYLRSESYRKALVYQKKYLLLLIGGFKDSEEATLALIAQMGAYPSDESLRRPMGRRSAAFTRFRSVVRVSIACSRMKFLVAKWGQASQNLSSCIESKHGVKVDPSKPSAVTASSDQDVVGDFPYLGGARATPTTTLTSHRSPLATSSTASSQRYPITPHHHRHDDHHHRSSSRSAALRVGTPSTGYSRLDDHLLGGASTSDRMLTHSSSGYLATASSFPTSNYRPSSSTRSREEDLEPPLKEYIRKLGNIQQKLSETTTPRYRR